MTITRFDAAPLIVVTVNFSGQRKVRTLRSEDVEVTTPDVLRDHIDAFVLRLEGVMGSLRRHLQRVMNQSSNLSVCYLVAARNRSREKRQPKAR